MEFGKAPAEELSDIDWALPSDDPVSVDYLRMRANAVPTRYFIGAPAWGHKEWVGSIYPPGTKASEFLHHYARVFSTLEFNSTHYRIPSAEQTRKWRAQVPDGFVFCPKVAKDISHVRGGLADRSSLGAWWSFLEALGPSRGPSFLQFPPGFGYSDKALLFKFLQSWPGDFELALEFRHPSWFDGPRVLPSLVAYLQGRSIGLVITDVAGRRDVSHSSISAPFTMVRFVGNDLHASDFARARDWDGRLRRWEGQGLERVFFFVHQPADVHLPEMAAATIQLFNSGRREPVLAPLPAVPMELKFESLR